jgi:hypothetical protein
MLLAFILSALTLLEHIQVWQIMVLAALLGVVNAFDIPARQAFIVEMVAGEDLINAIALNSAMFNSARILGPAIAGVTVAAIGEGWCFFANGASYIAVIVGLLLMIVTPRARDRRVASGLESIIEGFRFVVHTGPIRALLLLLGLVSLTGMPYAVLMPIFADKILHGGARGLGLLMGSTGVGALAATMALEIGEIGRFPSAEHLASYAGTTPRVHSSGDRTRYGPTRPDVNRYLKWAFAEAANSVAVNHLRCPDRHVSQLYFRLRQRKGHSKAIGAVARHLAEAAFHVLSRQQAYQDPTVRAGRTREV